MSEFLERIAQLSPKKLALLAAELRSRLDRVEQARTEPIAIVGVGCRLPGGAIDPESYWRLLRDGVDAITEIPSDRWDVDACWSADPDEPGKMYTRHGAFVDGLDQFDPHFFGIAPREALALDPQQRLLLEVTWEALEHAAQPIDALQGSQTGVFVGISSSNYLQRQMSGGRLDRLDTYVGTGNAVSVAAGRLSYNLGFQGPAISVDTACSSSLVAVHLACQSLLAGECRMAVAGGVNVILGPEWNVVLSKARMLAPDGRCKTFDASADGFGRGEGCGIVVLKRLADAHADGDRIMAVIRGSAVNQDGRSSGLTAPNGIAQEALIRQALTRARVDPSQVAYVEAHGTGTSLGDPIEIQAIAAALGEGRPADRPVLVGSVKTNVSHLEAAAGVAGLIKVVLALEHQLIPPHLHFTVPNPHIPWAELPVAVPTVATPWPAGAPRIAGLSSFGFSGTNAHVVIEEAPAPAAVRPQIDRPLHIFTLSAKTEAALDDLTGRFAERLQDGRAALGDVCFTANVGRAHFAHRVAVVGSTHDEVREKLLASHAGSESAGVVRGTVASNAAPVVAFLFTGQGSQYVEMGRALFETQPTFRRTLERCDELLRPHLDRPLLSVLYPPAGESSPIDDTGYTQPVLFAFEYALAELWRSWGVKPALLLGHSIGEYVAACVAGVLSLEDALALVAARGRLMQALPRDGAMAAIWADAPRVQAAIARLRGRLALAAINGPASVVAAGARADVEELARAFEREGVRTQLLNVSHAFHSPLMEPMLDEFDRVASGLRFGQPRLGVVSNVSGGLATEEIATPAYWRRHVREAVQFRAGMETLQAEGCTVFLEVGPTPTLLGLGRQCLPESAGAWLPSLRRGQDPWQTLLATLGALYAQGVDVDWQAFDADYARRKLALPTYPFQRERYWIEQPSVEVERGTDADSGRRSSDPDVSDWLYEVAWQPKPRQDSPDAGSTALDTWLLVGSDRDLGSRLAERLAQRGARAIVTESIDDAGAFDLPLSGAVYLWSPDPALSEGASADSIAAALRRECAGLLSMVQSLVRRSEAARPRLWIVTRGAQPVASGPVALAPAAAWGLARTIAVEHPELRCACVDLDPASGSADIDALCIEITAPDGENQIAFRDGRRQVARLQSSRSDTAASAAVPAVRGDRTYVITGGLGALGLHVAQWFVDRGARHLVLIGRRGPSSAAAEVINGMEASGAHVRVAAGDVGRRDDLAAILDRVAAEMPAIGGVIHAAGVLDDGVLTEQDWARFEKVLVPKVAGACHLHELTRDVPLDFFVLFSSMASVLGSAGQASYAAANAFLDALAHHRAAEGLPGLSVNWGPWAEGGMVASLGAQNQQRLRRFGIEPMVPARALAAFERLLGSGKPQVSVLPVHWRAMLTALPVDQIPPLFADMAGNLTVGRDVSNPASGQLDLLSRLDRTPASKRRSVVQAHVREHVMHVLGLHPSKVLGSQQGFRDLGMDSLMALELRNALQRSLGRPLPSTLAFDCPTIDALTTYVVEDVLALSSREPSATSEPRLPVAAGGDEPIAIVGLGCRLPGGVDTPEGYWELLRDGVDAISEVPRERWDVDAFYDPDPAVPGKMYTRHGGFLRDVDQFDASFFGISPREAVSLDPQHRLLLEVAWEALEHAGQPPDRLLGTKSGVFVGISTNDYGQLFARMDDPARMDAYVGTGNALSVAAGRLSYVLGLQGPSMSVDTACSSSLVAVHLACQSLRSGECRLALAGGVNLTLVPDVTINLCRARMLAPDGRCKTFDDTADGYVRSEGVGMVVLKRLSDAVLDGDHVLAVIRGSAVNQDGRTSGLTVPNGPSQQALIREALAAARIEPSEVGYLEAHGTGTSLGDPIELQAIGEVLGQAREIDDPLVIGSVKTNIGHLESAAGVAGLIKVVLALQHQEIPPHLHFTRFNAHAALAGFPAVIPTARMPWPAGDGRRVAGVSSFGFSGTNAHVVVEEAPANPAIAPVEPSLRVVTISAKSAVALEALAGRLAEHLDAHPSTTLSDVAFTLNAGRSHFSHRHASIAASVRELRDQLTAAAAGRTAPRAVRGCIEEQDEPAVVFLFTAEGSRRDGIARRLYETEPTFRRELEHCEDLLRPHLDRPLLSLIYDSEGIAADRTEYAQAASFAVEYALSQLWKSWGIEPAAVIGYGVGEYVAACVAGVLTLEDGLRFAAARGRLEAQSRSGEPVGSLIEQVERIASEATYSIARVPLVSGVTGELASAHELGDPRYWSRPAHDGASFAKGITGLREHGYCVFLEMGEASELSAAARSAQTAAEAYFVPSLAPDLDDRSQILEALAMLYTLGAPVDWVRFEGHSARRKLQLPTYPFQRRRYWIDAPETDSAQDDAQAYVRAVQAGRVAATEGPLDLALHTYPVKWRCSERLSIAYMIDALRRLGAFTAAGEAHTLDGLLQHCRILPGYSKLVGRWLQTLVGDGILLQESDRYVSPSPLAAPDLDPLIAQTRDAFAEAPLLATYLEGCGSALADVLTGKQSALETLFPRGSFAIADALYNTCPVARYTGGIVRRIVEGFVAGIPDGRPIRVLEIGAGTGGTAATLLPIVPASRTTYYFTDVSDLFLARAEDKFRDYPFVRYGLLDAERDPQEQGYPAGAFDLVVSVNALHATRNLDATIERARSLLRPGGMLLMSESTAHPIWFDVTVGLIEGWQLFEDTWRQDNPLLPPAAWRALFELRGLEDICIFPEAGSPAEIVGQSVLVARAPLAPGVQTSRDARGLAALETRLPARPATVPTPDPIADDFVVRLAAAVPSEQEELLVGYVRDHVTRVLRLDPADAPTRRQRLMDLGVDSLMAVELRNRLASGFDEGFTLPATLMFDYPTIEAIARYLGAKVLVDDTPPQPADQDDGNGAGYDAAERLAALSEDEAEALLIQKLESL